MASRYLYKYGCRDLARVHGDSSILDGQEVDAPQCGAIERVVADLNVVLRSVLPLDVKRHLQRGASHRCDDMCVCVCLISVGMRVCVCLISVGMRVYVCVNQSRLNQVKLR